MIKNIVFDLGNVLFKLRFENAVEKFTQDKQEIEILSSIIFGKEEWIKLDEGTITKEEAIKAMTDKLPKNLKKLCPLIMEDAISNIITLNEDTLNFIKKIRANGYKTYILSNTSLEIRSYLEKNNILQYFDGEIISAEEKVLKPNHKIYKILLERYSLNANECLFLDDREENIIAAEEVGLNGYVFNYNKFDEFLEKMKKYNIKF